jgi:hypothetical protein
MQSKGLWNEFALRPCRVTEDFEENDRWFAFEEFATFIRKYQSIPARRQITSETPFERDLGLTGDDGPDLLRAAETIPR